MKAEHSEEPVVELCQPLPHSFKTEVNWKLCNQTYAEDSFEVWPRKTWTKTCAGKITQSIWHLCYHSEKNDTFFALAKLYVQFSSSLLSLYHHSTESTLTPQCRKMSCLCALEHCITLWDSIWVSWSSPVQVQLSLCLPAYVLEVYSASSLGATWSAHHFWPGPVQTWGLGTESSRRSWCKVPQLGKMRSAWRTRCLLPRRPLRYCPPMLPEADPPAGLSAGPPAWRTPGAAAAVRSSAAGSSAPGTGYQEDLRGASCPLLQRTDKICTQRTWERKCAFKRDDHAFKMICHVLNVKSSFRVIIYSNNPMQTYCLCVQTLWVFAFCGNLKTW